MSDERSKFCVTCGAALIPRTPPRFDRYTGEKVNEYCPTGICEHAGVPHNFAGGGFFRNARCTKCGVACYYD